MKMVETKIIAKAMRVLAKDIQSEDGIANAACMQAAVRLEESEKDLKILFFRLLFENEASHSPETLKVIERLKPRFEETFCSQCGNGFGPGGSGFSHCQDHARKVIFTR